MKSINQMTQAEIAAYVQEHLRKRGIKVVLSGGAAVGIYSSGKYVSKDIDLVNVRFANRKQIEKTMIELGFVPAGRHFEHPDSDHIIEFPPGPLALGDFLVDEVNEIKYDTGVLQILSPTDCIKDRLAHYYHWGDRQCLTQAIMVAENHKVDISELEKWSQNEGKLSSFDKIKDKLSCR